jgi:putative transposase
VARTRFRVARVQRRARQARNLVAALTVRQILRAAGIGSAPRPPGPAWEQVLPARAGGILAVDVVHVDTVPLRRLHALIVIEL